MADNSSGNTASVAIVILVLVALGLAIWYFTQGGGAGALQGGKDVNVRIETGSGNP